MTFSPAKIVDYETFKENQDAELADLAWLFNMNRGIFMTPGREEEWTLSVTHTDEAVDRYVAVLRRDGARSDSLTRPPVLAATATMAALAAAVPNPCHDPRARSALPGPGHGAAEPSARRALARAGATSCLRMENRIVNVGAGPAELFGQRVSLSEMHARQVIADADGVRRRYETGAELYFKSVPSRGGSYWKFPTRRASSCGPSTSTAHRTQLVRTGPKHDYCLRDLDRVRGGPTAAGRALRRLQPARATATLGTSVGGRRLPVAIRTNWIDVTA